MSGLFITATGTGVGKTIVTAALTHQLQQLGRPVLALKPVISGFEDGIENDATILLGLQPGKNLNDISPWRFKAPLAPNIAAAKEGREIDREALIAFCEKCIQTKSVALIEGIGGSHVPLAPNFLVADWISALKIPAVVVTGSYLGAIHHTLSTLAALAAKGVDVAALVISESTKAAMPLSETKTALAEHLPGLQIISLKRIQRTPPWRFADDLTGLVEIL